MYRCLISYYIVFIHFRVSFLICQSDTNKISFSSNLKNGEIENITSLESLSYSIYITCYNNLYGTG